MAEALAAPDCSPAPADPAARGWHAAVRALGLFAVLCLIAFADDWRAMAGQWWNSSTYNHVLLVPPILAWLVHQRWPQLRQLDPQGWWPGLILFGAALFAWVLGSFAGVSLLRQAAVVAMAVSGILALTGPVVGTALAFPLAYAAFLVPFGDELVPALQMITAHITVALVHLSGIPAVIDGVFIETPAGLFEVAEACSGVKFLIAMVAFGVLCAHVCFRSWPRRAAFMAISIIVPILANGVRAWGTIAVAQVKGAAYAGGFDHIVYGWIFFAVVIALVIGAGWPFFDRRPEEPLIDSARLRASPLLSALSRRALSLPAALVWIAGLTAAGLFWSAAADRLNAPVPARIHLPEVPGWQRADYRPQVWWEPRAAGAEHRLLGRYRDAQGRTVDVFFALYSGQSEGREAGGFGQGALTPQTAWAWQSPGPPSHSARTDLLLAEGAVERLAQTTYRTGNLLTGSNARLKLANIADRLILREEPTMMLILSAERSPQTPDPQAALTDFRGGAGPLGPWMDRIAAGTAPEARR